MRNPSNYLERIGSGIDSLLGRRGRIALLIAGLATAPAACKFSLSLDTNFSKMDALRNGALDSNGVKDINAVEAGAGITLGKVDKKIQVRNKENKVENATEVRIGGLLYVYTDSPLRTASGTQIYTLPEDAAPWTYLVQETPEIITLRTKCDTLVLKFKCDSLTNVENRFCNGAEVSPSSVRRLCGDGQFCPEETTANQADAGAPEAAADAKASDSGNNDAGTDSSTADAQPDADEIAADAPKQIFDKEGEVNPYMPVALAPKIAEVMQSVQRLPADRQIAFTRRIVTDTHREELESFLRGYEGNPGNELNQGVLGSVSRFLLAVRPGIIPVVEQELKDSTRDAGTEVIVIDGDAGPEAGRD